MKHQERSPGQGPDEFCLRASVGKEKLPTPRVGNKDILRTYFHGSQLHHESGQKLELRDFYEGNPKVGNGALRRALGQVIFVWMGLERVGEKAQGLSGKGPCKSWGGGYLY